LPENSKNFTEYEEYFNYREYGVFSSKVVALRFPKLKLSGESFLDSGRAQDTQALLRPCSGTLTLS
jgi:hypothetical protein